MEPERQVPGVYIFLKVAGALGEKQTPGTGKGFTSFLREEGVCYILIVKVARMILPKTVLTKAVKRREAKRRYKAKYPDKWRADKSAQNARYRARQKIQKSLTTMEL
jgi:hypothetical protein